MEYNNCETSDYSSDSESSSFTNELTNYEKDVKLRKIDKLKRKIAELENISIIKEKEKTKTKKGLSNHNNSINVTNKEKGSSDHESFNNNKPTKLIINKTKKSSNKSPLVSEEDDTEFSSDEPVQVIIIIKI